jgi:hypothetical protein
MRGRPCFVWKLATGICLLTKKRYRLKLTYLCPA